jgi:hypothetical protein
MSTAATAAAVAAAVESCFAAVLSRKKAPSAWEGMEACHSFSNVNSSNVNGNNASDSNGSVGNGQSGRQCRASSAAAAASADTAVSVYCWCCACERSLVPATVSSAAL